MNDKIKILVVKGLRGSKEYNLKVFKKEFNEHSNKYDVTYNTWFGFTLRKLFNRDYPKQFKVIHGHSMGSIVTQLFVENQDKVKVHGMYDFLDKNEQFSSFVEGHNGEIYDKFAKKLHNTL